MIPINEEIRAGLIQSLGNFGHICAYKSFEFYGDKCNTCSGTPDSDICYLTMQELKEHLERWDCLRLEEKVL